MSGRESAAPATAAATGFLYPFIEADERNADSLLADLAASARAKAAESAALQRATLAACADQIAACGAAMAERFTAGGRLYAFGNGGSSTDCATFAALFARPPAALPASAFPTSGLPASGLPASAFPASALPASGRPASAASVPPPQPAPDRGSGWRALPALNLAADQAVVTALGNDVGFDLVFARQIIALCLPPGADPPAPPRMGGPVPPLPPGGDKPSSRGGRCQDIAVAFSTSGNSRDLMAALREASARGLLTVGFAGYDGGEMARSGYVEFCFTVRSQSVHRIQESQALLGYRLWMAVQAGVLR